VSTSHAVRLNLLAAVLSAALAVVSGMGMVGRTARLVDVITLASGAVGAGAGLAGAVASARKRGE
jgi:hypothetical protein